MSFLHDCIARVPAQNELLIVGPGRLYDLALSRRNLMTQAVLQLDESMLLDETTPLDVALDDDSMQQLMATLGVGLCLPEIDLVATLQEIRYGQLILVSDNSESGCRLRDQVVGCLFLFIRPVLSEGFIHVVDSELCQSMHENEFDAKVLDPETRILRRVVSGVTLKDTLESLGG